MLVEVLLEVEVRQGLTLRHAEQLLERHIRLDVVLVLQALLLDVRRDRLRDVGAAHLAALRLGEEVAQVIAQLRRDLEDAEAGRLRHAILIQLRRTALALARILDLAGNTLLELLQLGVERGDRLAEAVQGTDHATDLIANRLDRLLGDNRRRRNNRGDRRNDRRNNGRLGLHGLLGDGLLLGNRRSGDRRRGGNRRRGRRRLNGILLRDTLGNRLGGGRGRVHCTSTGGRIHLYFTHYLPLYQLTALKFIIRHSFFQAKFLLVKKIHYFFLKSPSFVTGD